MTRNAVYAFLLVMIRNYEPFYLRLGNVVPVRDAFVAALGAALAAVFVVVGGV